MTKSHQEEEKFLGRKLNNNTMMWEFADGSGVSLPEELRQQIKCDLLVFPFGLDKGNALLPLGRLFTYKDRLLPQEPTLPDNNK